MDPEHPPDQPVCGCRTFKQDHHLAESGEAQSHCKAINPSPARPHPLDGAVSLRVTASLLHHLLHLLFFLSQLLHQLLGLGVLLFHGSLGGVH